MPILKEVSVVFVYNMWVAKAELITASFVPKCMLKLETCRQIWPISKFSAPPPCPASLSWFLLCSVLLVGQALVHLQDS